MAEVIHTLRITFTKERGPIRDARTEGFKVPVY